MLIVRFGLSVFRHAVFRHAGLLEAVNSRVIPLER